MIMMMLMIICEACLSSCHILSSFNATKISQLRSLYRCFSMILTLVKKDE